VPNARLSGTYSIHPLSFLNFNNVFQGNGEYLRNLNATQLQSGTLGSPRLSGTYYEQLNFNNTANTYRGSFTGDGSGLTSLPASVAGVNLENVFQLDQTIRKTSPALILESPSAVTGNYGSLAFLSDNSVSEIRGVREGSSTSLRFFTKNPDSPGLSLLERMVITGTGKVGIGVSNPAAELVVDGSIKLGQNGAEHAPAGEEKLRIIRGTVNGNGCAILAGTGFTTTTCTGSGGCCHIHFDTPFSADPTVTATLISVPINTHYHIYVPWTELGSNQIDIWTFEGDTHFHALSYNFIAIGPR
jgi:hypothetical protein